MDPAIAIGATSRPSDRAWQPRRRSDPDPISVTLRSLPCPPPCARRTGSALGARATQGRADSPEAVEQRRGAVRETRLPEALAALRRRPGSRGAPGRRPLGVAKLPEPPPKATLKRISPAVATL